MRASPANSDGFRATRDVHELLRHDGQGGDRHGASRASARPSPGARRSRGQGRGRVAKDRRGHRGRGVDRRRGASPSPPTPGKESDCIRLVEAAVARFGKVDVLVNNAATNPYFGPMLGIDEAAWDKTFEVNLKGYFWMIRERRRPPHGAKRRRLNRQRRQRRRARGRPAPGLYGATKAAVISMTKTLALRACAPRRSASTPSAPGLIDTRFASGNPTQNDELSARGAGKDSPRAKRPPERDRRRRAVPCQ